MKGVCVMKGDCVVRGVWNMNGEPSGAIGSDSGCETLLRVDAVSGAGVRTGALNGLVTRGMFWRCGALNTLGAGGSPVSLALV